MIHDGMWYGLDEMTGRLARRDDDGCVGGFPGQIIERIEAKELIGRRIGPPMLAAGALALTWELVKSDLPPATKKGTLCRFDHVLGLGLMDWTPAEDVIPDEIAALGGAAPGRAGRQELDRSRCAARPDTGRRLPG